MLKVVSEEFELEEFVILEVLNRIIANPSSILLGCWIIYFHHVHLCILLYYNHLYVILILNIHLYDCCIIKEGIILVLLVQHLEDHPMDSHLAFVDLEEDMLPWIIEEFKVKIQLLTWSSHWSAAWQICHLAISCVLWVGPWIPTKKLREVWGQTLP